MSSIARLMRFGLGAGAFCAASSATASANASSVFIVPPEKDVTPTPLVGGPNKYRRSLYNGHSRVSTSQNTMRISVALVIVAASPAAAHTDWPVYGHDAGGMRYSPLKQITPKNVSKLQLAWSLDTVAPIPQGAPAVPLAEGGGRGESAGAPAGRRGGGPGGSGRGPRQRRSESTPLVVAGVMYVATGYARVLALEPETGKKIWEYESAHPPALRGMAYWAGDGSLPPQIVFGTNDGWLISLNAKTGKPVPGFGTEGLLNMKPIAAEKFPRGQFGMSSAPSIYRNLVITGSQVQEGPTKGVPGDIRAWDMRNGKLLWTFHTIPRPGEPNDETWVPEQAEDRSGANAWGNLTVDTERGLVFAGVGQVTRDFDGSDRKGLNLYGSSIVALDANTGKLKWYFQTTHHDNWDYDPTSPPMLFDVVRKGKKIPAVALPTKAGLLFLWDRVTGKPIHGVEERPVGSENPIPGDEPWPTQPFPMKPPPLARMTFDPSEVAKVNPEHEKFCRTLLETEGGALGGGPYAQYGPKLRVIFPSWIGGGNWGGGSFDPKLGYLFVNMQHVGNLN